MKNFYVTCMPDILSVKKVLFPYVYTLYMYHDVSVSNDSSMQLQYNKPGLVHSERRDQSHHACDVCPVDTGHQC